MGNSFPQTEYIVPVSHMEHIQYRHFLFHSSLDRSYLPSVAQPRVLTFPETSSVLSKTSFLCSDLVCDKHHGLKIQTLSLLGRKEEEYWKQLTIHDKIILKVSCHKNCFHSRSALRLRMVWVILREERERETSRKKEKDMINEQYTSSSLAILRWLIVKWAYHSHLRERHKHAVKLPSDLRNKEL